MSGSGNKKAKRKKYHTDDKGHFVWENFFVRGRRKRAKRRVTVVGGQVIDDIDELLRASAGDDFLHSCERWDIIGHSGHEANEASNPKYPMKPSPRVLRLEILELESAFESLAEHDPCYHEGPFFSFLDLTCGAVVTTEDEEETVALMGDGNFLLLPSDLYEGLRWGALDEFVHSLPKDALSAQLARAIRGKGAFRRFKDIVFGGGNVALKHQWLWFETRRKRERIVQWLKDENIQPDWGAAILEAPPLPDKRADLLRAVLDFVRNASALPGVRRIALLGSLATPKEIPKDVDLLVSVDDDMPLDALARLSRRLSGATMATGDGCGADIFLCNPQGAYLGRVCSWKTCAPGIRQACKAQHCGRRQYLHDDLQIVRLDDAVITAPPLELRPHIIARSEIPHDVQSELISHLQ